MDCFGNQLVSDLLCIRQSEIAIPFRQWELASRNDKAIPFARNRVDVKVDFISVFVRQRFACGANFPTRIRSTIARRA